MKTPEEIVAFLAYSIGNIYYHRPLMYGGTAAGVDLLLLTYHEVWSTVVGRERECREMWWTVLAEQDCGSANFSTRYAMDHPNASEEEIVGYVVAQWRKVSERLGVPIPHAQLECEMAQLSAEIERVTDSPSH